MVRCTNEMVHEKYIRLCLGARKRGEMISQTCCTNIETTIVLPCERFERRVSGQNSKTATRKKKNKNNR